MKLIGVRLIIAFCTFALGVGLSPLFRSSVRPIEKETLPSNCVPVTFIAPDFDPQPTPSTPPVSSNAACSSVIADFDPEKFSPYASYMLLGGPPKGFGKDESIWIEVWAGGELETCDKGNVSFGISGREGFESMQASFALLTERRMFFVTKPTEEGVAYRFDGEFLRRGMLYEAPEGRPVLKGWLTKTSNNRTVAQWFLKFEVLVDGC